MTGEVVPKKRPRVRGAVSAGRFDASIAAVLARLHGAADRGDTWYMSTEVMGNHWDAIKKNLPAGWKAVHREEYLIAWDGRVWKPKGPDARFKHISSGLFNRGHIKVQAKSLTMLLTMVDGSDDGTYFTIVHLPAHLQDRDDYSTDLKEHDEVVAHKQALVTLGADAARRKAKYPTRRQALGGDVNVDLFRDSWRGRLDEVLGLEGAWRPRHLPEPGHGDLGKRLITGLWTYGFEDVELTVVPRRPVEHDLDHACVDVDAA